MIRKQLQGRDFEHLITQTCEDEGMSGRWISRVDVAEEEEVKEVEEDSKEEKSVEDRNNKMDERILCDQKFE